MLSTACWPYNVWHIHVITLPEFIQAIIVIIIIVLLIMQRLQILQGLYSADMLNHALQRKPSTMRTSLGEWRRLSVKNSCTDEFV